MKEKRIKEYVKTWLCLFGFHNFGEWQNKSKFIDGGGWNFGWVARWGKTCEWCGGTRYKRPFLKSDRDRMIKEANIK